MRITLDDSEIRQPDVVRTPINTKRVKKERSPISTKQKIVRIILLIIGIISVVAIAYFGYFVYKAYKTGQSIGLNLRPADIITQKVPELKKDSTGKHTNALIVGIDTRETGNLLNTDSIILVSYNYDTNDVIMMSIPRDLHVQIKPDVKWYSRINAVYSTYEPTGEGEGFERLCEVVTEITNKEIQYYSMIDYKGFVELINTLGGIDINVENSFTDYMYPDGVGYKTVKFVEGPQHMDGETALEYSRSRHSMHNNEGTDFARARRQQNVISAITEKVMSGSLLDPKALTNLFNVVQDNIQISEFTIEDIDAGVRLLSKFKDDGEIYSFVLDPSAGVNRLLTSQNVVNTGAYAIGPIEGLGKYDNIHDYIDDVWSDPQLYEENPIIKIYNIGLGSTDTTEKYREMVAEYPYLNIGYMGTLNSDKEGTISYLNDNSEKTYSLEVLNKYIKPDSTSKPEYITSRLNAEDITILFGKPIVEETVVETTE
jgi:LCP family protein required for cell wall assembly